MILLEGMWSDGTRWIVRGIITGYMSFLILVIRHTLWDNFFLGRLINRTNIHYMLLGGSMSRVWMLVGRYRGLRRWIGRKNNLWCNRLQTRSMCIRRRQRDGGPPLNWVGGSLRYHIFLVIIISHIKGYRHMQRDKNFHVGSRRDCEFSCLMSWMRRRIIQQIDQVSMHQAPQILWIWIKMSGYS